MAKRDNPNVRVRVHRRGNEETVRHPDEDESDHTSHVSEESRNSSRGRYIEAEPDVEDQAEDSTAVEDGNYDETDDSDSESEEDDKDRESSRPDSPIAASEESVVESVHDYDNDINYDIQPRYSRGLPPQIPANWQRYHRRNDPNQMFEDHEGFGERDSHRNNRRDFSPRRYGSALQTRYWHTSIHNRQEPRDLDDQKDLRGSSLSYRPEENQHTTQRRWLDEESGRGNQSVASAYPPRQGSHAAERSASNAPPRSRQPELRRLDTSPARSYDDPRRIQAPKSKVSKSKRPKSKSRSKSESKSKVESEEESKEDSKEKSKKKLKSSESVRRGHHERRSSGKSDDTGRQQNRTVLPEREIILASAQPNRSRAQATSHRNTGAQAAEVENQRREARDPAHIRQQYSRIPAADIASTFNTSRIASRAVRYPVHSELSVPATGEQEVEWRWSRSHGCRYYVNEYGQRVYEY